MEAKDTVLTQEEINAMDWTGDVGHLCREVAQAQAEITWNEAEKQFGTTNQIALAEGFKAGIKEVVKWFMERATKIGTDGGRWSAVSMDKKDYLEMTFCVGSDEWQAKLKEWGR